MAHVLSLTDGTVSIDLAETTDAGYHFVSYAAPRPNRILTRIGSFPFGNGERTVASGLGDVAAEIVVNIVGTSADDLDARLQALVRLLEQAQRWEERRIGTPVRLLFKRQGVTNTAYRVITGVPLMPEPVDPDGIGWLDGSSIMTEVTVSFTVTLEPLAHADTLTTIMDTQEVWSEPDLDYVFSDAAPGSMDAPLAITIDNSSGTTLTGVWLARLEYNVVNQSHSGTVDATASGGSSETIGITGTESQISLASFNGIVNVACRGLARIKVLSGDPSLVQLQFRVSIGSSSTGIKAYGPWVQFQGIFNEWTLADLGAIHTPTLLANRTGLATGSMRFTVWGKTTDGSSVSLALDYVEILPYADFMKLTGTLENTNQLHYDTVLKETAFYWPSSVPQAYVTTNLGATVRDVERYGMIRPVPPSLSHQWWSAVFVSVGHPINGKVDITIDALASYSLGLRGNA